MILKRSHFQPRSLTWWASLAPIVAGVVVASEPLHGLSPVVDTIDGITGGLSPAVMINAGLAGIGFRGAIQ